MGDIDQIIAGGAGSSSRADFSKLGTLWDSLYKSRDEAAKNDLRTAFPNGIPKDANGNDDWGAVANTFFQKGGFEQGVAASNLGVSRDQLKLGQEVSAKMGNAEGGGTQPQPQQRPIVSPSSNRNVVATEPPLNRGGLNNMGNSGAPTPQQGGSTITQIVAAQGIPNDQLQAASASIARQLGVDDPNSPIDINDPKVRNVLVPAIQQLKRAGIGQVVQGGPPQGAPPPQGGPQPQGAPQGQPGAPPPQQAPNPIPPQVPQNAPNPQQNQGTFGAPSAIATRGAIPTGTDPEIQKQIATYTAIASNPAYPKPVQEAALARLKALQEQNQPTGPIKEYDLARRQGYQGTFQDFLAENEAKKTGATEEAKLNATKYQTIVDNGTKAQQEIPQLRMLQEQMNDPNFFSGAGEKYVLLAKRLKAAVGMDPDAAVPQEILRKVTASNVLSSLGALKGLGQIRVAEINMAREAAASPDNSVPANKLLTEISIRTHQRNADIADMAQAYKEKNGTLDAGFDKLVTKYGKEHPLFNDAEIKDWGLSIGRASKGEQTAGASQKFSSPADVHAAVAAGKLKKGDSFKDANGVTRYVP